MNQRTSIGPTAQSELSLDFGYDSKSGVLGGPNFENRPAVFRRNAREGGNARGSMLSSTAAGLSDAEEADPMGSLPPHQGIARRVHRDRRST
jgi:hypothetical protein